MRTAAPPATRAAHRVRLLTDAEANESATTLPAAPEAQEFSAVVRCRGRSRSRSRRRGHHRPASSPGLPAQDHVEPCRRTALRPDCASGAPGIRVAAARSDVAVDIPEGPGAVAVEAAGDAFCPLGHARFDGCGVRGRGGIGSPFVIVSRKSHSSRWISEAAPPARQSDRLTHIARIVPIWNGLIAIALTSFVD